MLLIANAVPERGARGVISSSDRVTGACVGSAKEHERKVPPNERGRTPSELDLTPPPDVVR